MFFFNFSFLYLKKIYAGCIWDVMELNRLPLFMNGENLFSKTKKI